MKNRKAVKFLLEAYANGGLNRSQTFQLEMIVSDALTYEGGALEMKPFDKILNCRANESNWKPVYYWTPKK